VADPYAAAKSKFTQETAGFPECKCPPAKVPLDEWCDLVKHKPPKEVEKSMKERGVDLQNIDKAKGDINLDYYTVNIDKMPVIDGHTMTPDELLTHIRMNPDDFFDPDNSDFDFYDDIDATRWASDDPLGSLFNINFWLGPLQAEDGSVIATLITNRRWIFTTVDTWGDFEHPVSGNREFGFLDLGDGTVIFYTRGADRLTGISDASVNWLTKRLTGGMGVAFMGADRLWQGYQKRIADFVNANGGKATIGDKLSQRVDYDEIKKLCGGKGK